MSGSPLIDADQTAISIEFVTSTSFSSWLNEQPERDRNWLETTGFKGSSGTTALIPGDSGALSRVIHCGDLDNAIWSLAALPERLPAKAFRLDFDPDVSFGDGAATRIALGWWLGGYNFERYKKRKRDAAQLVWPEKASRIHVTALAHGLTLARDLINTPAEDMGPGDLAAVARTLAGSHGAEITLIEGDALLEQNYRLIHAVGRGSSRPPVLIDLRWGDRAAPKLTLVGKGVCFDSGGLDIKSASGMKLMKKDMGGAATVLGLAHAIMATRLNVCLRVLIPAVENSISANAFRPMDVFQSRNGMTVEIGNTDAEGRLVLGDALTEGESEEPALLLDIATLTGAARTALGPDLPALFCNNDALANDLLAAGTEESDPMWRLPLWKPYRKMLDSRIADINSASDSPFGGAITAALYLQEFVSQKTPWAHIDSYAWNSSPRPGRPEGGEALGLRAIFSMLERRFG